jgi:hypothetical protein
VGCVPGAAGSHVEGVGWCRQLCGVPWEGWDSVPGVELRLRPCGGVALAYWDCGSALSVGPMAWCEVDERKVDEQSDVAQELAGLLQRLKSRSNLSYQQLARKTFVSSSALHRYCSGASVCPLSSTRWSA